ncbi:MAG: hypothetical protein JWO89_279 [Verrucomicrobiaceae bacterium]|nr:hypothetical protein [Verrucomicrobiaceae bacterium]
MERLLNTKLSRFIASFPYQITIVKVNITATQSPDLAASLCAAAERGRGDAYYRLARMVARVLVSVHLRQRKKWCSLAEKLASSGVAEERLVLQAMNWLQRRQTPASVHS